MCYTPRQLRHTMRARGRSDRWPPREAAPHPTHIRPPEAPQGRGAGAPQTPLAALTLNPSAHPAHHTDSPHEFTIYLYIPPFGALWAQRVDADILGHSEDTLANITLVPPLSPSRRSVLALERLLDASVQLATVRLKLEAISPPPLSPMRCSYVLRVAPQSSSWVTAGNTPPHMLRTAATACCAQRPFVGSASSQPRRAGGKLSQLPQMRLRA